MGLLELPQPLRFDRPPFTEVVTSGAHRQPEMVGAAVRSRRPAGAAARNRVDLGGGPDAPGGDPIIDRRDACGRRTVPPCRSLGSRMNPNLTRKRFVEDHQICRQARSWRWSDPIATWRGLRSVRPAAPPPRRISTLPRSSGVGRSTALTPITGSSSECAFHSASRARSVTSRWSGAFRQCLAASFARRLCSRSLARSPSPPSSRGFS